MRCSNLATSASKTWLSAVVVVMAWIGSSQLTPGGEMAGSSQDFKRSAQLATVLARGQRNSSHAAPLRSNTRTIATTSSGEKSAPRLAPRRVRLPERASSGCVGLLWKDRHGKKPLDEPVVECGEYL